MKNKTKKKIQWSKVLTFLVICFCAGYGIWSGIEYYQLCKLAIEQNSSMPEATLAVTCVTTILASLISYCLYSFGLKNSLNKNNLTIDEISGLVTPMNKNDLSETIDNIVQDNMRGEE